MAWIEAHQELPRHPKTKRFARMLRVTIPEAVGHLLMLWWWALDYAENGDISRYDAFDIADAAQWEGEPEEFLRAMIECGPGGTSGFIERTNDGMFIHDWEIYSGRPVDRRPKILPVIYAYILPDVKSHEGFIKIGYTERDAETRIKEQTHTAALRYKILLSEPAIRSDGSTFTDKDIHAVLLKRGYPQLNPDRDKNEWFRCSLNDVRHAITAVRNRTFYGELDI